VQPLKKASDLAKEDKIKIQKLYIRLRGEFDTEKMDSLMALLKFFNGNTPVCLYYEDQKIKKVLQRDYWVKLNETLISELSSRLGEDNVKVV